MNVWVVINTIRWRNTAGKLDEQREVTVLNSKENANKFCIAYVKKNQYLLPTLLNAVMTELFKANLLDNIVKIWNTYSESSTLEMYETKFEGHPLL